MDLLQNCDLPPPLKLFSPIDKEGDKRSAIQKFTTQWDAKMVDSSINLTDQNPSLLRALQLSQSRAREAERKVAAADANRERMACLLLEESLRLSAHKQWVTLLEMEIFLGHKKKKKKKLSYEGGGGGGGEEEDALPAFTWCLTLAFCFGLGFALGRYMF